MVSNRQLLTKKKSLGPMKPQGLFPDCMQETGEFETMDKGHGTRPNNYSSVLFNIQCRMRETKYVIWEEMTC